jgi:HK97 family phage portal protein
MRGNAYSRIVAGARGRVDRLMPLRADRMRAELRDDGRVLYRYQPTNGGPEQVYLQDEILRLTGLSGDGINGLSVIGLARQTFAMAKNAETHSSKLFANSARPGGVLQMTGRLSPQGREHLRQSWQDLHSGPENAGRIALLEEGMTWQSVGMTSEDAQLIESRKFEIAEIARWFRIPPHMIGDLERSTNNNIEHQSIDFVVHTIRPWLVMWEQSIRRDVMSERERDDLVVEFLVDGLLRGDANARTIVYKSMLNDGWGTPNEVREKENMNPIEGGDELRSPLNMVPAGSRAPGQTADPDDQPPAAAAPEGSAEPPTPLRLAEVIHLPGPDQMPPLESDGSSIDLPVIAGEAA